MPRSRTSRKAGWWPGQRHGRAARSHVRRAIALLLVFCFLPVQAQSLLHIRVLDGEGAIHAAGSKSSRPLVIEVTDETGKPVDGAAVSFRLPDEGPGGTFAGSMRTDIVITSTDGKAALREMLAGRMPGPFQIRVTAVRDGIRAGTVVDQYISDQPVKKSKTSGGTSGKKVLLWTALAGGAAAAGLAAGLSRGGGSSAPASTPSTPAATGPSVGVPVITIGRPQ